MLEIQKIRNQSQEIVQALDRKGVTDATTVISELLKLDQERKRVITEVEEFEAGDEFGFKVYWSAHEIG